MRLIEYIISGLVAERSYQSFVCNRSCLFLFRKHPFCELTYWNYGNQN